MSKPDTIALCVSDLLHSDRVDSPAQMRDCIRAVCARLEALAPTEAAAMAATVPDGWKLVPEMPTKEMLVAAGVACEGRMYPASMTHGPRAQNTDRYIAMLDAAPQAPVADQAADEARMLRDLLARIHGDGGQYLDQHGLEKAVQDADEMVAKWQAGQPAEPSHIHRKSGGRYTLLGQGRLQCDTPLADMAEIAIYRGEDGRLWARDAVEFAGRFDRAAPKGDSNG